MRRSRDESAPLTLGQALRAHARPIVWCKLCRHQVEPDVAELVARYSEALTVIDWTARLRCSRCGGREVDFVITGDRR